MSRKPTIEQFTKILFNSGIDSPELRYKWGLLGTNTKKKYIDWFYSDRSESLENYWSYNDMKKTLDPDTRKLVMTEQHEYPDISTSSPPIRDKTVIDFFEKFTKDSVGLEDDRMKSGSRRRRRPSRKYKKSAKRVFRKKSRSTRRR